jgi:hypothetical protein
MSKHPIDELFRKNLGQLEEEYPQHLWQGVAERLGESKKPRRALWLRWTSLGMFLLLAIAGGAYILSENYKREIPDLSEKERLSSESFVSSDSEDDNKVIEDDPAVAITTTEGATVTEASVEATEGRPVADLGENAISDRDQVSANITNNSLEIGSDQANNARRSKAGSVRSQAVDITANKEQTENTDKKADGPAEETFATNLSNAKEARSSLTDIDGGSVLMRNAFETSFLDSDLGGIRYDLLDKSSERLMRRHSRKSFGYSKNRMVLKWGIAGIYSTDFAIRQMNNRTPEGLALLNYRDENERFVNAFSTGIEVSLRWHQLSFITGLIYSQVNDEYTFVQDNAEQIVDGVVVQGRYEQRIINRYASYELPLIVQYEMSKGRWVLGAGFGLHLGLHYSTSGKIFDDSSLTAVDLESDEGSVYRSSLSAAPVLSMMAGYKLGYRSLFFFRPSVRHYLEPLTKDEYSIDHRQQIMSLTAGIRYTIN